MKKIRLEFRYGKSSPSKQWLKVIDNRTEAFEDRKFTVQIPPVDKKISLNVEVPDELELIEITGLGGTTPDNDISFGWCMDEVDPNWRIPGLKKITIIFDDRIHEVPVINEKPDRKEWDYYREHECNGWLFMKSWALEVYSLENKTVATFRWHPNLIRELEAKKRPIILSSKNNLPCMWEKGGKKDKDTGSATIICNAEGKKVKPIFVKRKGMLSRLEHALIVIHEGYVIIEIEYRKSQFKINILKIVSINVQEYEAEVEYIDRYGDYCDRYQVLEKDIENFCNRRNSDGKILKYKEAILAAYKKANCYHCIEPYFVKSE